MTRSSSSSTGITRHLSNAVHGCDTPHPTRSPGSTAISERIRPVGVLVVERSMISAPAMSLVLAGAPADREGEREALVEGHVPSTEADDREIRLGSGEDGAPNLDRGVEPAARVVAGRTARRVRPHPASWVT